MDITPADLAPPTTEGSIWAASADGSPTPIPPGTEGQVLSVVGGEPAWSSTLLFTQAGAGAVERAPQDKAREERSIDDFRSSDTAANNHAALVAASAYFKSRPTPGGRLTLPSGYYAVDGDPKLVDYSGFALRGEGAAQSIIENVALGRDLFQFSGTHQFFDLENVKIKCAIGTGALFNFLSGGMSFSHWTDCHLHQADPALALFRGDFTAAQMYSNRFVGGQLEHGSGNVRGSGSPTVAAFQMAVSGNRFNDNRWLQMRIQLHHSWAPFFDIRNNSPDTGAWNYNNVLDDIEVEAMQSGFALLAGQAGFYVGRVGFYDSDNIDNHVFEFRQGGGTGGGKRNERCVFAYPMRFSGDLVGVVGTEKSGTFVSSGTTVTATVTGHGKALGQRIQVTGGIAERCTVSEVTDANHLKFEATAPPASGSLTVATAAMDIVLGPSDQGAVIHGAGSIASANNEIDASGREALIISNARLAIFRGESCTILGQADVSSPAASFGDVAADSIEVAQLAVGGGTPITRLLTVDVAGVVFPSIAAHDTEDVNVTVAGVKANDTVEIEPQGTAFVKGLIWVKHVLVDGQVVIRMANITAGAITPATKTWRFRVTSHA